MATTTSAFIKKPNYGANSSMFDAPLADYGVGTSTGVGDTPMVAGTTGVSPTYNQRIASLEGENSALSRTNAGLGEKSMWNKDTLAGAAGLGSVLLQAVALPDQLKMARTQRKALEQNMDFARQEQSRRNSNIAGFNRARPSQPTSAFAQ